MKFFYLLLATLILSFYSAQACQEVDNASGVSSCENVKIDPNYDDDGAKYCCYVEGKEIGGGETDNIKECWAINEALYDKIDDYIDGLEKAKMYEDLSIDCVSNYIMISLLSLILLFLW